MSGLPIAFGGGMISKERAFYDDKSIQAMYDLLEKYGVKIIDTAQLYEGSEELIGQTKGGSKFTIDTKWKGGFGGGLNTEEIVSSAKESMQLLGVDKVDIFYVHAPDTSIKLSDWLPGVDQVYKTGVFTRFGLSNFQAADVEAVYNYCKEHNIVLPTVYQGNYSAVARKQETLLFPTLRKLGISFYAYSPIAGGFLTKTKQQIADGAGRFKMDTFIGQMYGGMYGKPTYLEALGEWEKIAEEAECSRAELAYRWVSFNSALKAELGDVIIVGSSSHEQLEQTLKALKNGPLPEGAVKKIDEIWKTIEHEAPLDNYHR